MKAEGRMPEEPDAICECGYYYKPSWQICTKCGRVHPRAALGCGPLLILLVAQLFGAAIGLAVGLAIVRLLF